ncbi:SDR family oxidoreductase [Aestuariibacter halophilus]|uniref:SDR family oxidoreductase n=1 Tax=Fluctibacter halophilus TaxID=226011 RepID=A0ABS8G445_9ALTE|nr:SDR family oxidoreductase [Aestuariibacter halophilus]MCC2615213.1 SDR family oxidoreductase [Aestuariibacter halophilus]
MDTLLDFNGKSVLITGAANGFGRGLAIAFAERGANLILNDIDADGLAATCQALPASTRYVSCVGDIAEEALSQTLVQKGVSEFGQLDIAINNAGIAHSMKPIHQLDAQTMQRQVDVNLNGVLFGMKYQLQQMLTQGRGHIMNVASMAGLGGAPKGGAYAAVKHGVVGLTRTAAVEYAKAGIQVNAICPYFTQTNILKTDGLDSADSIARMSQGCPMKRIGRPEEIVSAMVLMLSPANTYMTGQAIAIDGGVSAW